MGSGTCVAVKFSRNPNISATGAGDTARHPEEFTAGYNTKHEMGHDAAPEMLAEPAAGIGMSKPSRLLNTRGDRSPKLKSRERRLVILLVSKSEESGL